MTPPPRPNLKAQILADLDSDHEVIIEAKYIPLIWGSTDRLNSWCESWGLVHKTTSGTVKRTIYEILFPIYWLEITRANTRAELTTAEEPEFINSTELERTPIDEADASL